MAWSDHYVTSGGTDTYANSTNSGTPCSLATAIAGCAAGDRINIKAGTYSYGASVPFATAGSTTAPIWWRGYKSTIGDLDAAGGSRIPGTDLPLISLANTAHQITSAGAHQIFSNLAVTSICTTTSGAWAASGGNQRFIRCQIENTQANSAARAISFTGAPNVAIGCWFKATTTAAIVVIVNGGFARMSACQLVGGIVGLSAAETITADYLTISGFTTTGISVGSATRVFFVSHCSVYAAATNAMLVTVLPTTGSVVVSNCIFGGCTYGVYNNVGTNTNGVTLVANQFYACGTDIAGLTEQGSVTADLDAALFNATTASNDPWVAKASANFNLAAGVAARSSAYPGVFDDPSGTTVMTGYPDKGAVRHIDPSGGGGETSHVFIG